MDMEDISPETEEAEFSDDNEIPFPDFNTLKSYLSYTPKRVNPKSIIPVQELISKLKMIADNPCYPYSSEDIMQFCFGLISLSPFDTTDKFIPDF